MKLYVIKNTTSTEKTKCLLMPFRSGTRFIQKVYEAFPDKFDRVVDLAPVGDVKFPYVDVRFLEKVSNDYWSDLELYMPMRDPFDQYCSCLDLLSIGQNHDIDDIDLYSYGLAKTQTYIELAKQERLIVRYSNRTTETISSDRIWHFDNSPHNRPTVLVPLYLTLCGVSIQTLDMKTNQLTKFVEENVGKVDPEDLKDVTGYAEREGPNRPKEIGEKLYYRIQTTSPQISLWLQVYIDAYNNFTKDMNQRSLSENMGKAMQLYYTLKYDPVFAKVCSHESDLLMYIEQFFLMELGQCRSGTGFKKKFADQAQFFIDTA